MQAEQTRIRFGQDGSGLAHAGWGVRDQGGQDGGGATAAMRGGNGAGGGLRGCVVEQQAAAAIDLNVDQARDQQRTGGQGDADGGRLRATWIDAGNHAAAQQQAVAVHPGAINQQGGAGQEGAGHAGSLPMFTALGRAGSLPGNQREGNTV
jgi:hypothetical protein